MGIITVEPEFQKGRREKKLASVLGKSKPDFSSSKSLKSPASSLIKNLREIIAEVFLCTAESAQTVLQIRLYLTTGEPHTAWHLL